MGFNESELKLAKEILLWIQYSTKLPHNMGFDWLRVAVGHDWDPNEKDAFVAAAIAACNGLVEFSDRGGFGFTHLTVREYFEQKSLDASGQEVLIPDKATAMLELASRCVEHLLAIAPSELPLDHCSRSIYESGETMLSFHKSFEAYVTEHWVYFLSSIPRESVWTLDRSGGTMCVEAQHVAQLRATIGRFLRNPLAVGLWIENLYALNFSTERIVESITNLTYSGVTQSHSTDKTLAKQLAAIAKDLQLVERDWGAKLREKPYLIWSDVVIFSKLDILSKLDTSRFGTVSSLLPRGAKNNGYDIPPLCSISSTLSAARVTGVLTIIPPAEFVRFWHSTDPSQAYTQGESFCEGWVANYEVWAQDSKFRLASFKIPLPQKEILVLFRQSFRHEIQYCLTGSENPDVLGLGHEVTIGPKKYKTSFPLAIGHDCLTFAVPGVASRPVHLKTELDVCPNELLYDGTEPDHLASLSFSVCGDFILARNATDTVVLPLPEGMKSNTELVQHVRPGKRKRSIEELGPDPSLGSLVHLASDQHLPERTLSGAHLSIARANATTVSLIPGGNNVSLELSSQGPLGEKTRRQLVALPNNLDTKDKAITVKFPETPDEHLRIILDKIGTESYTLDEDRRFSHPTVIKKNVGFVEPMNTSAAPGFMGSFFLDFSIP
ncbi:hypothetical protein PG997_002861 [Apiospora hydei]|uniref:Uncharacterized protein n=1 Tax=Apiospora hydei TaxID=1337664 RepID=A0ABR1WXN5_9PEZI